jgi:hypothetical protein
MTDYYTGIKGRERKLKRRKKNRNRQEKRSKAAVARVSRCVATLWLRITPSVTYGTVLFPAVVK